MNSRDPMPNVEPGLTRDKFLEQATLEAIEPKAYIFKGLDTEKTYRIDRRYVQRRPLLSFSDIPLRADLVGDVFNMIYAKTQNGRVHVARKI